MSGTDPNLAPVSTPAGVGATLLWLLVVSIGIGLLWRYKNSPGLAALPARTWVAESKILPAAGLPRLVMFAHPRCPCTRASLGELSRLMARCPGRVRAQVVFYKPAGAGDDWARTDLWRSAEAIPGVSVTTDEDAVEAKRFGAATSGHTVLYDAQGRLQFSGGITYSRGHSGDNAGRSAIVALLENRVAGEARTPVFGCSLLGPNTESRVEP